jgi:hypothetical protein
MRKKNRNSAKLSRKMAQRMVVIDEPSPTTQQVNEQVRLTQGLQELLARSQPKQLSVKEFVKANGYTKIDPSIMFITSAQESSTGLYHAVLLAPDNETETGFRRLSTFREGTMLPESSVNEAAKMIPTVAVLVGGLYEWPHFDYDMERVWKRKKRLIQEAQARRDRRRAKRMQHATN